MRSPQITFVNHASVKISNSETTILTDPWYEGHAFNQGWLLLHENKESEVRNMLDDVNYIWISHEHPDHFSILFFKKYLDIILKNKIKVIFQETKDKRVISFLKKINIETIELKEKNFYNLSKNFKIKIIKSEFYDSALILHVNNQVIFNLNDCPLDEQKHLKNFERENGNCDLLLTQFSYAAWKGGKDNEQWRKEAASKKLSAIKLQKEILKPKTIVPFASFIYFSHEENFYLNDHSNKVKNLSKFGKDNNLNFIVMRPFECQNIDDMSQNNESYEFWNNIYDNLDNKVKLNFTNKVDSKELIEAFENYQSRIFNKNSKLLIWLFSKIPFLNVFSTIKILLNDSNQVYAINLVNGINEIQNEKYDVVMNSNSLLFLLKNDFGFDTLTVNGCFDIYNFNSFSKFAKFFSIGNLNNLGIFINLKVFFNFKLFFLFLSRLRSVKASILEE